MPQMQEQGRRKPHTTMSHALIYSPNSRLGLIKGKQSQLKTPWVPQMQGQGRRKPHTTMSHALIYSPSSRLGLIITNDNHKLKNEDNVKNQLERSHKGMKDVQTMRRSTSTNIYMTY